MADLKPQPNHAIRLEVLRRMTPEQRLLKALELSEITHQLMRGGLRARHPELGEDALHRLYLERLARCYNRNY